MSDRTEHRVQPMSEHTPSLPHMHTHHQGYPEGYGLGREGEEGEMGREGEEEG